MRIGITGHQRLPEAAQWEWTREAIEQFLARFQENVIGITSLAIGVDQLFASIVLANGGTIEVVVPFDGYEEKFTKRSDREAYERFVACASVVVVLRRTGSDEEAYFAAGKRVVEEADLVIAVWDGKPAAGLGGTGDVVVYALQRGKPLVHMNPISETMTGAAETTS